MGNIKNVLNDIKKRPSMYIGEKSLKRLYAYLNGYCMYNTSMDIVDQEFIEGLYLYIVNQYRLLNCNNWCSCILFYSGFCDSMAFDEFYVLFDLYCNENT